MRNQTELNELKEVKEMFLEYLKANEYENIKDLDNSDDFYEYYQQVSAYKNDKFNIVSFGEGITGYRAYGVFNGEKNGKQYTVKEFKELIENS